VTGERTWGFLGVNIGLTFVDGRFRGFSGSGDRRSAGVTVNVPHPSCTATVYCGALLHNPGLQDMNTPQADGTFSERGTGRLCRHEQGHVIRQSNQGL